jgi:plasmid stabilization system protein ParE
MATVIWSAGALEELALIRYYIAQFDPRAAERVAERLLAAGDSLRDFPRRGRQVSGELRRLSIVWPYILEYEIARDTVQILRVRHGARSDERETQ